MQIFYSDTFELPLPPKHRFPMSKYRLLRERIATSELAEFVQLQIPDAATDEQLQLVHTAEYLGKLKSDSLSELEIKRIGFPWSSSTLERSRRSVGASISAALSAIDNGISVNLAGGTHHAFPDSGQGYCVFNDVCVAARVIQSKRMANRILFIDCDVHQGNGTAAITKMDPDLFSFSVHCNKNYPFRKQVSDLDLALPPGTGDQEYLEGLSVALDQIKCRFSPELIFYVSGADPYELDRLGLLALTKSGLKRRDEIVFEFAESLGVPVAVSMAGGYADDVNEIVDIHYSTVASAMRFWQRHQNCIETSSESDN